MKVRIGFGFGGSAHPGDPGLFGRLVAALESLGFASLWAAIAADMGTSLLVTTNGLRLLRSKANDGE